MNRGFTMQSRLRKDLFAMFRSLRFRPLNGAHASRRGSGSGLPTLARPLVALLVAILGLSAALGAVAAARQLAADDASPAQGHAQVVAHGVAAVPSGEVAWRVVSDTADLEDDAETQERALGFALADQDAFLINDLSFGTQARLAAGEATFVPSGVQQQRIALGDAAAAYYRIALIPAGDADDAGGDDLIFSGEGFAAAGNRDLDLVRDVVAADDEAQLADTGFPTLVLATAGSIEVETADGAAPTTLAAGEAAEFEGALSITTTGAEEATFVAAVIGPEVPALPTPSPTATPAPDLASLTVQALGCPVAYEGDDFAEDCTEPLADIGFRLVIPATEFSVEGTTDDDGEVTFEDLGENTYALTGGVPAEFAIQTVECANEDGPIAIEPTGSEIPGAVLDIAAGDEITCAWYVMPEDLRGESGTIAVSVKLCPTADTPVDNCEFVDLNGTITVSGPVNLSTGPDSDVPVRIHGVSYVWGEEGGVPLGEYFLNVDAQAPAGSTLNRVEGSTGSGPAGFAFTIDADNPNAILYVIYVGAGDADGDGATDDQEAAFGTNPADPDTDDDGATDGEEINYGDPGPSPTDADSDDDGLSDGEEMHDTGTNPTSADSDNDGVDDGDDAAPLDPTTS